MPTVRDELVRIHEDTDSLVSLVESGTDISRDLSEDLSRFSGDVQLALREHSRASAEYVGELDAAYRPDHAADPSRDARSCVDPTAARLLRDIAAGATRAKVLLTTRLMPADLEDRAADPLAGVLSRELKEMSREDALNFMDAQGVKKGTPAEVAAACSPASSRATPARPATSAPWPAC